MADLFQMEHKLSVLDLQEIESTLKDIDKEHCLCSACGFETEPAGLRKHLGSPVEQAICLPCFLLNYTDETQEDIDRMSTIGRKHKWWF